MNGLNTDYTPTNTFIGEIKSITENFSKKISDFQKKIATLIHKNFVSDQHLTQSIIPKKECENNRKFCKTIKGDFQKPVVSEIKLVYLQTQNDKMKSESCNKPSTQISFNEPKTYTFSSIYDDDHPHIRNARRQDWI